MTLNCLLLAAAALSILAQTVAADPVEVLTPDLRGAIQPHIAVTPSGRVHVVFGKENAIYHTTSPDGRGFSSPVKIGTLDKFALGMRRGPRVTATDQTVLVTGISHADGNLHAWMSGDAGRTWKESESINTAPKSASEGLHALTGDARGLVAVVWLDLRAKGMELWGKISRDGGATWAGDILIYQSPDGHICECCVPNVAISSAGEIAVLWRNWLGGSRDLYLATSRDGLTFSAAQKLGTGTWKLNACPMDGGSLAFAPEGSWLAVWRRERAIFESEARTSEKQLAANANQPVVAYAGATPLVLWEADGALILKRGAESPSRFAEKAGAASMANGPEAAAIVWESSVGGAKTILFDRVP